MARYGQQQKCAAARAFNVNPKTLVSFFVEQRVGLARAENVTVETVRPLGRFVFDCIEKRAIVRGPSGARDALYSFCQSLIIA